METTKKDIAILLTLISSAWPRFEPSKDKVEVWFDLLKDIPPQVLGVTIKRLIAEREWAPSISDVRKEAVGLLDPDKMTPAEAWGQVQNAVRTYGQYRAKEGVTSLSPRVKKVVDCIGWSNICMSENISVIRGQFMKMYEQVQQDEFKERLLPKQLRREAIAGPQLRMIEGGAR